MMFFLIILQACICNLWDNIFEQKESPNLDLDFSITAELVKDP